MNLLVNSKEPDQISYCIYLSQSLLLFHMQTAVIVLIAMHFQLFNDIM